LEVIREMFDRFTRKFQETFDLFWEKFDVLEKKITESERQGQML
jgi:hypothetical protein